MLAKFVCLRESAYMCAKLSLCCLRESPYMSAKCFCLRESASMRAQFFIGVRDRPYGICCPWVRGGWDLDALGKFFRRRRRCPRLRVPLLFEWILITSRHFLIISYEKLHSGTFIFKKVVF